METIIKPDKKYYTKNIWMVITIIVLIVISVAVTNLIITLANGDPFAKTVLWWIALGCVISMIIIVYPLSHLWIKNLSYIIREDRVTIHKGILTKTKQNIPYRAITDFVLHRSLYDRFLGIGSIRVQTAGQSQTGTGYEGNLAGLLNYDDLHGELREKIKVLHPASEGKIQQKSTGTDKEVLDDILDELKKISRKLDK
jgi:uncharacterized membrane protein YdbT with pleckstrin-like domain